VSEYGGKVTQTCKVLTLEEDGVQWRQAEPPPALVSVDIIDSSCLSATVNGIVHFLSSNIYGAPADHVLCFNLESEEWTKAINGPLNADTESWRKTGKIHLAKFNDALCMIQTEVRRTSTLCANIWLLVKPGSSIWVKTYVIPMARSSDGVQPLWLMPDDVRLLLFYFSLEKWQVRVYDPCTGTCTGVMEMPKCAFGRIALCNLHLDRLICGAVRSS
jgi:F-box interacting protein